MVDYRKFDNIVDSDEEVDDTYKGPRQQLPIPVPQRPVEADVLRSSMITNPEAPPVQKMTAKGKDGRLKFEYEGRTIYEWEQSLTEVNIYIAMPPGVTKKLLDIRISPHHLRVGIKDQAPYLDEETGGPVRVDQSMWLIDDGEINVNLQKMNKAEAWECALRGRSGAAIDVHTKEEVKKKLMLERFQEEHPGFDFSGAEFNGQIPDAREFMGGVKHF